LIALGGALEVIQGLVGRDADIHDEIANTLGVLIGGVLGWGIVLLHAKLVARQRRN
jgi:VanZ family protein